MQSTSLDEYFPYFIRERLIRDLIVFKFHHKGQPMRAYFDQVFQAAEFLQYEAIEQQLIQRVVMSLHPDILNLASFVDKPRSRKELAHLVGLIEEKSAILTEREKLRLVGSRDNSTRGPPAKPHGRMSTSVRRPMKCWGCGQLGHVRRSCPRR